MVMEKSVDNLRVIDSLLGVGEVSGLKHLIVLSTGRCHRLNLFLH